MGQLQKRIEQTVRNAGSITNAQMDANNWFLGLIKKSSGDADVLKTNQFFLPGRIYVFGYFDPVTPNLPWWDRNPVVLSLGMDEHANDIGLNLNLLPYRERMKLLDFVYDLYYEKIQELINTAPLITAFSYRLKELNYYQIKPVLKSKGWDFAIRSYKSNNRLSPAVVGFSRWIDVALLDLISLTGKSIITVFNDFIKWKQRKQ